MQNSVLPIGAGAVDGVICLISESGVNTENGGIWAELCVLFFLYRLSFGFARLTSSLPSCVLAVICLISESVVIPENG